MPMLESFEVWAYARRGYPPSDNCTRPKTFADDVADLHAVLTAVGGSADVLGASYGAIVALHTARSDASSIRRLVLFEPPLFSAGAALTSALDQYRRHLLAGELSAAALVFAAEVARVPPPLLAALTSAPESSALDRANAVGCLHDLEAMAADTPDLARWADVFTPTLLMQGTETWAPMPATMDALAAALPHVNRTMLTGQAHFATHTAPAAFGSAVSEFLSSSDLPSR